MKDNFSKQSDQYARFRPVYPQELIDYLISRTDSHDQCWDCGTGNGQLAVRLAETFEKIYATDISEKQLNNATPKFNIDYSLQPAEQTNFPDQSFDLITVAQAAHWFDFERFNSEVKRLLKPNGVIVLIGYGLVQLAEPMNTIVKNFYWNVTKPYWDPERNHIEEQYRTIPFPFEEIKDVPHFEMKKELTLEELTGYIGTWSAVQHYIKANGHSPIDQLQNDLKEVWTAGRMEVSFPMFMRVGSAS